MPDRCAVFFPYWQHSCLAAIKVGYAARRTIRSLHLSIKEAAFVFQRSALLGKLEKTVAAFAAENLCKTTFIPDLPLASHMTGTRTALVSARPIAGSATAWRIDQRVQHELFAGSQMAFLLVVSSSVLFPFYFVLIGKSPFKNIKVTQQGPRLNRSNGYWLKLHEWPQRIPQKPEVKKSCSV